MSFSALRSPGSACTIVSLTRSLSASCATSFPSCHIISHGIPPIINHGTSVIQQRPQKHISQWNEVSEVGLAHSITKIGSYCSRIVRCPLSQDLLQAWSSRIGHWSLQTSAICCRQVKSQPSQAKALTLSIASRRTWLSSSRIPTQTFRAALSSLSCTMTPSWTLIFQSSSLMCSRIWESLTSSEVDGGHGGANISTIEYKSVVI